MLKNVIAGVALVGGFTVGVALIWNGTLGIPQPYSTLTTIAHVSSIVVAFVVTAWGLVHLGLGRFAILGWILSAVGWFALVGLFLAADLELTGFTADESIGGRWLELAFTSIYALSIGLILLATHVPRVGKDTKEDANA